jgi:hypothetical protein
MIDDDEEREKQSQQCSTDHNMVGFFLQNLSYKASEDER